ncbi:MAG TPA: DNA polymerase Y family protein [Steroidobacteraceae bacterium]|nr:DNA polymerase Y family protein [Steroidobacteraceae bacterium]
MRHRRALELPFQESTAAQAPQQPAAPRSGDLLRPPAGGPDRAAAAAPAELWLAVHLAASPPQPARQDLERLGARAQRLTPRVSLDPPDSLLLEVKGSLHLFGGVEGVSREMAGECSHLRMPGTLAVAPTPLAALALARAGRMLGVPASLSAASASLVVTDPAQLIGKLSPLPLATLRWPQDTLDRLARIGVRTVGEVLRLPRAGFARRFGTAQLQTLDRLVGRSSDLKDRFEVRARFRRRRELIHELESHAALLAVLEPLLGELGEFLEARQCGVLALECRLRHRAVPPTRCVLRLAAPLAQPAQLAALLAERLSALVLPEPVRACELRSGPLVPRVLSSGGLWQPGEQGGGAAAQAPELIERLRVRLGAGAVQGIRTVEDHRPEAAWEVREPVNSSGRDAGRALPADAAPAASWPPVRRPFWLLPKPRQLDERDGLPRRRGPLRLLGEAERIETGWWDGGEVARNYYTAQDMRGVRLWVFREREPPHRWFLHGIFG